MVGPNEKRVIGRSFLHYQTKEVFIVKEVSVGEDDWQVTYENKDTGRRHTDTWTKFFGHTLKVTKVRRFKPL